MRERRWETDRQTFKPEVSVKLFILLIFIDTLPNICTRDREMMNKDMVYAFKELTF